MIKQTLALIGLTLSLGANADIIGGSDIISGSDSNQLEAWLGQGPIDLTRIFTKQSGDRSYEWHSAVDGQGSTFTVIELDNGNVIGGYNALSWTGAGGYNRDPAGSQNFLFNLTNDTKYDHYRYDYYTYDTSTFGPTFGGGHDLYIRTDLTRGYANLGHDYECNAGSYASAECRIDFAGGFNNWTVVGLETFTISEASAVPIPAAAWLFGSALLGLGVIKRRQS